MKGESLLFDFNQLSQYGWTALSILVIILGGLIAYLLLRRGLNSLSRKNYISESLAGVLRVLFRWAVIVLVVLLSLQQLGAAESVAHGPETPGLHGPFFFQKS